MLLLPAPVIAASGTSLSLDVPEVVPLGTHPTIRVRLQSGGRPLAGAQVDVLLGGHATLRLVTGADGRAETRMDRDLPAGVHEIQARFRGTAIHSASRSVARDLTVEATSFVIATVPPLAGVTLISIDGKPQTTDAEGLVRVPVREVGVLSVSLTEELRDLDRQVQFLRWAGSAEWGPTRTVRVPSVTRLEVGLEIRYAIRPVFRDPAGASVDASRIDLLQVRDDHGGTRAMEPDGTTWLPSNTISRLPQGLKSTDLEYRIEQAVVDELLVVNRGQQRFTAASSAPWEVEVLLYTLRIRTVDALFGSAVGANVRLLHPDGRADTIPVDAAGTASVTQLPRGDYELAVVGEAGMALKTPVALSREQEARVLLVSLLDVGVVGVVGLFAAAAAVVFGRRAALRLALRSASAWRSPARDRR